MSEVERYAALLKGENPKWPELKEFKKTFLESRLLEEKSTPENLYEMIRFVVHKELQRFESKLVELLCKSIEDQKLE